MQVCLQADILDLHSQLSLAHAALERPAPSANGAVSVTADSATVDDVDTGTCDSWTGLSLKSFSSCYLYGGYKLIWCKDF